MIRLWAVICRGSEICVAHLQQLFCKLFRLFLLQESRSRWRCSPGVRAVCCMYRDERVIFVVNAACLYFFLFMYRLEVCLVSLYMLRFACCCAYENRVIAWTGAAVKRHGRWASKWMFKIKTRGGWKEGWKEDRVGRRENISCTVEDGLGRRLTQSFNSFRDFVNASFPNSVTCLILWPLWFAPLLCFCALLSPLSFSPPESLHSPSLPLSASWSISLSLS